MLHVAKYQMKCKLRNRSMLFWNLLFPLILTTLFGSVLLHAYDEPVFETIEIAVVDNATFQKDTILQETLKQAKNGDRAFFHIAVVDEAKAKTLLKDKDITAYIVDGKQIQVNVGENGLNQTITQMFFDEYIQHSSMIEMMLSDGKSMQQIQQVFSETTSFIKEKTSENNDVSSVFFFSILAMNALIGGHWAIGSMYNLQANLSSKAQRMGIAPIHKAMNLCIDMCLNVIIQTVFLIIILMYMIGAFHVSFGSNLLSVFLLLVVGSIAGNGFGTIIGNLGRKFTIHGKNGLLTSLTLFCSMLAGMMMFDVKYLVQLYIPIVGYINPVNMITDGLYALYYYGIGDRYFQNLIFLIIFTILCYVISYFSIRKKSYDNLEVK